MAAVDKVLTTAHEYRGNAEFPLSELAEVNKPNRFDAAGETIDNYKI